jgi:hypothetical protein
MRNVWISFGIFLVMIVGIYISLNYLNSTCAKFENDSSKLETLINDGKWDDADKLSNELFYEWEDKSKTLSIFINHMEIDAMNNEMLKLTQYVKCKSKDEALASNHAVKFYSKNITSLQKINIQNIF